MDQKKKITVNGEAKTIDIYKLLIEQVLAVQFYRIEKVQFFPSIAVEAVKKSFKGHFTTDLQIDSQCTLSMLPSSPHLPCPFSSKNLRKYNY